LGLLAAAVVGAKPAVMRREVIPVDGIR